MVADTLANRGCLVDFGEVVFERDAFLANVELANSLSYDRSWLWWYVRWALEDCLKLVRTLQQIQPKASIAHPAYISSVMKKNSANEMGILLKKMQRISVVSLFKANELDTSLINGGGENKYSGCRAEDLFLIQQTTLSLS
ncbi:hypothetical protein SUGI_0368510 [Cryptomeria japonica]|nr:hypothetical protein SUGI_0368510 [Cryptomeria japonica]